MSEKGLNCLKSCSFVPSQDSLRQIGWAHCQEKKIYKKKKYRKAYLIKIGKPNLSNALHMTILYTCIVALY